VSVDPEHTGITTHHVLVSLVPDLHHCRVACDMDVLETASCMHKQVWSEEVCKELGQVQPQCISFMYSVIV